MHSNVDSVPNRMTDICCGGVGELVVREYHVSGFGFDLQGPRKSNRWNAKFQFGVSSMFFKILAKLTMRSRPNRKIPGVVLVNVVQKKSSDGDKRFYASWIPIGRRMEAIDMRFNFKVRTVTNWKT